MPTDIFKPLFEPNQLDSNFKLVSEADYYDSSRGVINEVFNSWEGFDNHFISEFQTTGFNARLWELYLYITFKSLGFDVQRCPEGRPDFFLQKGKRKIYVEAVTTNPAIEDDDFIPSSFDKEDSNIFFLKLRSTLLKKLKKKYWDLEWVKNNPFVLALSPFHSSQALNVTDFEVRKYLYGVTIDKEIINEEVKTTERRDEIHHIGEKKLSNFYDIPLTSNISGILYSNSGTMGKFMRMGYQAGYGKDIISFFYSGSCHNYDPKSIGIAQFMQQVKRGGAVIDFKDEWRFGLSLFHNQNATVPIGYEIFDDITQVKYELDGGLFSKHIFFHPYNAKNLRNVLIPD